MRSISLVVILLLAGTAFADDAERSYSDALYDAYKKYFESPDSVPQESYQWLKEDFENIGVWEYEVKESSLNDSAQISGTLNELGKKRWELVTVLQKEERIFLLLKRRKKSYLRSLPAKDLFKLLNGSN